MTEKAKELLNKLDHNLNDILFDLVDENETLEGQVNELKEQVARLTEKQNRKTVDVKLGGELIYRQAVLEAIEDDTRLGMYSRFASNNDAQCFKQVVNEIPPAENKGDLISRQAVLDELEKWDWQELYLPIHFKQILDDVPSVENKGEWLYDGDCYICNQCKSAFNWWADSQTSNFCPNCGARMKGGE